MIELLILVVFAAAVVVSLAILAPFIPVIVGILAIWAVPATCASGLRAIGTALKPICPGPYVVAATAFAAVAAWAGYHGATGMSLCLGAFCALLLVIGWFMAREEKRLNPPKPKSKPYVISTELAPEHRQLVLAERRRDWLQYWHDRYVNHTRYPKAKDIANYLEYSRSHQQLRLPSWEEWVCFETGRPRKHIGRRCTGYDVVDHFAGGLVTTTINRGRLTHEGHVGLLKEAAYGSRG